MKSLLVLAAVLSLSGCAAMRQQEAQRQQMIANMSPYERVAYYDRLQREREASDRMFMNLQQQQTESSNQFINMLGNNARNRVQVAPFNCQNLAMPGFPAMISCQ